MNSLRRTLALSLLVLFIVIMGIFYYRGDIVKNDELEIIIENQPQRNTPSIENKNTPFGLNA